MLHILNAFSVISENKKVIPDKINLFKFDNTNLEVIVKRKSYLTNLENVLDYFTQQEEYEICSKLQKVIAYIKNNNNVDL
nr:hypothetical protein [uncultured Mediterranean phage uvMED]